MHHQSVHTKHGQRANSISMTKLICPGADLAAGSIKGMLRCNFATTLHIIHNSGRGKWNRIWTVPWSDNSHMGRLESCISDIVLRGRHFIFICGGAPLSISSAIARGRGEGLWSESALGWLTLGGADLPSMHLGLDRGSGASRRSACHTSRSKWDGSHRIELRSRYGALLPPHGNHAIFTAPPPKGPAESLTERGTGWWFINRARHWVMIQFYSIELYCTVAENYHCLISASNLSVGSPNLNHF